MCGFYLHYHDEVVPELVRSWNVQRLVVHRQDRHRDATTLRDLFQALDNFLKLRRCTLTY